MIVGKLEFGRIVAMGAGAVADAVAKGMPGYTPAPRRGHEARVELEKAVPWIIARAKAEDTRKALDEARTRLADQQERRIALHVRRIKGEVVEVALVEATWTRLCAAFRSRILGMPAKLAGLLVGVDNANVIKDRIEVEALQALAELSDEGFLHSAAGLESSHRVGVHEPDAEM